MERKMSITFGLFLIIAGIFALGGNTLANLIGLRVGIWEVWRLWPLTVLALGMLLFITPVMARGSRWLGALFIPALPILTTGAILFIGSVFDNMGIWEFAWPFEVLSLGLGFLFAAVSARTLWFAAPAIFLLLNGSVMLFTNTTGLWDAWAVLWAIEPLSVGLFFFLVAYKRRSPTAFVIGLAATGFAGLAFVGMSAILTNGIFFRLGGPILLILLGAGILAAGYLRKPDGNGDDGEPDLPMEAVA